MQGNAEFTVRPLVPADAGAAAAVIRTAFAALSAPVEPPPSALRETAESVAATIGAGGGAGADGGGTLVGAVLWVEKEGGLYVARLSVHPAWRGRGVARALVAAAEAEARRRALPRMLLSTRLALNDNRRLFVSCGFRETAQHAHPGYAAPTFVDMEKTLDGEDTGMTKPAYDSRADTLAHIHAVRDAIDLFVAAMLERGRVHDASKFSPAEKPAFDEIMPLLPGVAYGSPEYEALVRRMGPALAHHYQSNSHHPEHHPEGIAGMDLFDVVEMVCDWIASAARNPGDGVRLDYNVKQFAIEPQLASILANTLARWPRRAAG